VLAGCGGPGKGDVSGVVTIKGEPISVGRISFLSQVDKQEVFSAYLVRGKYTIKDCTAGPVTISVESFEPPDPATLKGTKGKTTMRPKDNVKMERPPELEELASGPKLKFVPIPQKYSNPESSGLTYEVQTGPQTHDIVLAP